jgi:hypothetical protein
VAGAMAPSASRSAAALMCRFRRMMCYLLGLVDRRLRSDRGNSAVEGLDSGWKRLEIGKPRPGIGVFSLGWWW